MKERHTSYFILSKPLIVTWSTLSSKAKYFCQALAIISSPCTFAPSLFVFTECTDGDIILIQDADLEYDPSDYERLLRPIKNGLADVVFGTRFIGSEEKRVLYFWHSLGNKLITLISNIFSNLNLTDVEVGYKVFRSDVLKAIKLKENRFGFEPEITAKVAKKT